MRAMDDAERDALRAEVRRDTLQEVRDLFERLSGPNSYAVERLDILLKAEKNPGLGTPSEDW